MRRRRRSRHFINFISFSTKMSCEAAQKRLFFVFVFHSISYHQNLDRIKYPKISSPVCNFTWTKPHVECVGNEIAKRFLFIMFNARHNPSERQTCVTLVRIVQKRKRKMNAKTRRTVGMQINYSIDSLEKRNTKK